MTRFARRDASVIALLGLLAGCGARSAVGGADAGADELGPRDPDPDLRPAGAPCDGWEGAGPQLCYSGPPETRSVGECRSGLQVCEDGRWSSCAGEQLPAEEVCDLLDNDCDLLADEGLINECGSCELGCGLATECLGVGCTAFVIDGDDDGVFVREDGALALQPDRASGAWSQVFSLGPDRESWGCLRWDYEDPDVSLTVELRTADRAESLAGASWEAEATPTQRRAPFLEVRARFEPPLGAAGGPVLLALRILAYASCT